MSLEHQQAYCAVCKQLINVDDYYPHMDSHSTIELIDEDERYIAYYSDASYDDDSKQLEYFEMYDSYLAEQWQKEDEDLE